MSFIYRRATADDRNAYIDFINYVFSQAHRPHDFKALIPKVYGDGRITGVEHFLATDENGNIRGCVAVYPYDLSIAGTVLKVGFIGSVSVHPYARGENHMKKLMAMAEEWMIGNGIDLGVLGGLRQRYQYFGYSKGGTSIGYGLTATNARHALRDVDCSAIAIEKITDAADARLDAICDMHASRPIHALRSRETFLDVACTWYNSLYAVMNDGVCCGYLIGADGGNIAEIELADAALYPQVFKQWLAQTGAEMANIVVLPCEIELIDFLDKTAEGMQISENENFRIFNWQKTLQALLTLKQSIMPLSDGTCCVNIDGEPLCVRIENGNLTFSGEACACAQSLTALQAQDAMLRPAAMLRPVRIGGAPADWFPLPLCMTAPDGF